MDDIYGHLDNYNDIHELQELRSENQALKQKLEENSLALVKLKKDYDMLASEFKTLEVNYSSLLKTARAEIDRKTLTITNLNIEKDAMVLKSMQNGNFRGYFRGRPNMSGERNVSSKQNTNKMVEGSESNKNVATLSERNDKNVLSKESVTRTPIDNRINNVGSLDTVNDKKTEFKENVKCEVNNTSQTVARSIKDRRKSMPALCEPEKFSSEEEIERECPTKKNVKNDISLNDKPTGRQLDRLPVDRHSNKTSETSSLDERNAHYPREAHRSRYDRHHDDKYRSRDKYDSSERYRRYKSSDRGHRRPPRDYQDDYHHRRDHGRHRVPDSPPPDHYNRYNQMSSHHQQVNRDHRPHYDRYPKESDRYRSHYDEKQPYNCKMPNDFDEPISKRQRIESVSSTEHLHHSGEKRYSNKEQVDRVPHLGHAYDYMSCQSPDYAIPEVMPPSSIREIKDTATTFLEDPRKYSSKYVQKTDGKGATTLSTVTGRNVEIRPINTSWWKIARVDIPKALMIHPSQYTGELLHDIYMDVDRPIANISMGSGEIGLHPEEVHGEYHNKDIVDQVGLQKPTEKHSNTIEKAENTQISDITKYRIPKLKHNQNMNNEKEKCIKLDSRDHLKCKTRDDSKQKQSDKTNNPIQGSLLGGVLETHDDNFSAIKNDTSQLHCTIKPKNQCEITATNLSNNDRVIIEGDLELSDENSDIDPSIEKTKVNNVVDKTTDVSIVNQNAVIEKQIAKMQTDNVENSTVKEINASTSRKSKDPDIKRHKGRKKKSKSKELREDIDNNTNMQKKTKPKKEKLQPKDENKRFCDLFGDSSSLIMPEDLGIATYVPAFEDAQDAVDLNLKQIVKDQTPNDKMYGDQLETYTTVNVSNSETSLNCHNNKFHIKNQGDNVTTDTNQPNDRNVTKASSDLIPNIIYENLNPDTTVDNSDVVKTIVISTGVQPQYELLSKEQPVVNETVTNIDANPSLPGKGQHSQVNAFKKIQNMKALATSTPQKGFEKHEEKTENGVLESICEEATADGILNSLDCISSLVSASAVDQNVTNTQDDKTDAPDVRIFVRRRRKTIKKPPAS